MGTMVGGRLADWSILRSLVMSSLAMGLCLAGFTATAHQPVLAASVEVHRRDVGRPSASPRPGQVRAGEYSDTSMS